MIISSKYYTYEFIWLSLYVDLIPIKLAVQQYNVPIGMQVSILKPTLFTRNILLCPRNKPKRQTVHTLIENQVIPVSANTHGTKNTHVRYRMTNVFGNCRTSTILRENAECNERFRYNTYGRFNTTNCEHVTLVCASSGLRFHCM